MERNVKELIKQMTPEEKASLCLGGDFWHTKAIERLGIPSIMITDGPFGLRKQSGEVDHLGLNESNVAIAFPAGVTLASSWSPEMAYEVGEELGKLCQMENVGVILGPAMNIKRSPLCGRNFEYYSEDPVVSSKIAAGMVKGVQSKNVGTSPKHFLANNQEHYRQTSNSVVDERTLREIYLASFEGMVKDAQPWTMMCSYNKINGTYACENKEFLTDVLRKEWGYQGYVMTDWGALDDPVESIKAGTNLGMPGTNPDIIGRVAAAIESGDLPEEVVDASIEQFLNKVFAYVDNHDPNAAYDFEEGHEVAKKAAEASAVLLKNEKAEYKNEATASENETTPRKDEKSVLPLSLSEKVAFIGTYAKKPRYQGGGSSHIHAYRITNAMDSIPEEAKINVSWCKGCMAQISNSARDEELMAEAIELAKKSDKAVIFAGLPESYETEGLDRKNMRLPENQDRLIEAVAAVQPNTIVVLHNGCAVEMPWIDQVKAVLEMYLGGEATGEATSDLLYGITNPSGKLAETFPIRLEDNPTYPYYGVERKDVPYREGIMVGYRYYETMKNPVLFPFGHGLSYTSFAYSNLTLDKNEMDDTDTVKVSITVKNTGCSAGAEIVQLYVAGIGEEAVRPVRELKGMQKVFLQPGQEGTVSFELSKRAFAYWNTKVHDWYAPTGSYKIQIGKNASEILLEEAIQIHCTTNYTPVYGLNDCIGDLMRNPVGAHILGAMMGAGKKDGAPAETEPLSAEKLRRIEDEKDEAEGGALTDEATAVTGAAMPLRSLLMFSSAVSKAQLEQLLAAINGAGKQ